MDVLSLKIAVGVIAKIAVGVIERAMNFQILRILGKIPQEFSSVHNNLANLPIHPTLGHPQNRNALDATIEASMLQNLRKLQLTELQRDGMRAAGQFNARLMDYLRGFIQPGISTGEIDRLAHDYTIQHRHTPATLGYLGYTKSCCTSVNDVICHGIPSDQVLGAGDIINVDITSIVDGWHGDQSETFFVGDVCEEGRTVCQCAFDAMHRAIAALEPGCPVSVIGDNVVAEATKWGFSVVREYVGHGLGRRFHQYPNVPHYPDRKSRQDRLLPGMCFTVEPMINAGSRFTKLDTKDNWTVRTRDGRLSAQFEHTVLMTESGPEILTQCENGPSLGHRFLSIPLDNSSGRD